MNHFGCSYNVKKNIHFQLKINLILPITIDGDKVTSSIVSWNENLLDGYYDVTSSFYDDSMMTAECQNWSMGNGLHRVLLYT